VQRAVRLAEVVAELPDANRGFLQYLMNFLHKVSLKAEENLMTPKNLAVVFGPNILRPRVETVETAMNDAGAIRMGQCANTALTLRCTAPVVSAVQGLIEFYPQIWGAVVEEPRDAVLEEEDVRAAAGPAG
jgi:hypothetical protein